ncbi:immunoglobulin superfamily containing leucine-rich repeat protein-like [Rhinatrema bivittatum]|uniref:immunoglobulin superfamily containing leucine-rich repeat protein-like n=1 Tax=Rhinatrema bivittatum TaxID=194408 RepID=UPI001129064B|nr:immunoglobulin superfamily containing leucine-rich repeat protein-like [Rhinatrema bivittatum]
MYQVLAFSSILWILFVRPSYGCPEICQCSTKAADCAYRALQFVPSGFSSNLTRLSLSSNSITSLDRNSFVEVIQVTSLWITHNKIQSIEKGTFEILVGLKSLDVSQNQIIDFPWEDLNNLTSLQLLKMDHNHMVYLPWFAFRTLKDLRSLQISDNKFTTISEKTFDSLSSLSYLQIHNNPFNCTCHLMWIKYLPENTLISIPEKEQIICSLPENLKGTPLWKLSNLPCVAPSVHLTYHPKLENTELYNGSKLMLYCSVTGRPQPIMKWKIQTSSKVIEISESHMLKVGNNLPIQPSRQSTERFFVFKNGSLIIPHVSKQEEGTYTCSATNELGSSEESINVSAASSEKFELPGSKACDAIEMASFPHGQKVVIIYQSRDGMKNGGGILFHAPAWLGVLVLLLLFF